MTGHWKAFLSEHGATYAGSELHDFGNLAAERRAARDATVLVDLSHLGFIQVEGADAAAFLNGQLTKDVARLTRAHSALGAWCSPKGRMLALFRVFRRDGSFLLQLPTSLIDDVIKRLRVYVLRSKVTLASLADSLAYFGIAGNDAPMLLRGALGTVPENANDIVDVDGVVCARIPGIHARFEILAAPDRASRLWLDLARGAVPAGTSVWIWHDIMAGIPSVQPQTREAFVPQMANLDLLDAVDFDKGCYTGQEIVARLHYRGRLKQRLYRARTMADTSVQPGDPVYVSAAPQATGSVVSAAADPDGGYALLAVIHCDDASRDELRLHRPDGPRLMIEPLPYALPA